MKKFKSYFHEIIFLSHISGHNQILHEFNGSVNPNKWFDHINVLKASSSFFFLI